MSWFSDAVNTVNNTVDAAQDFAEVIADGMQAAVNAGVDTAQIVANAGIDAQQGVIDIVAGAYDNVFGTTLFGAAAAALNGEIDGQQAGANAIIDGEQAAFDLGVDIAQFIGRDYVDLHQYAHTVLPKWLDDTFGDGSVNMPPVPVSAQILMNAINGA